MPYQGVFAAVSAEIRSGNYDAAVLDRLHDALERDEVSAEEEEYLREILENN